MSVCRKQVIFGPEPENTKTFICDRRASNASLILFMMSKFGAVKSSD